MGSTSYGQVIDNIRCLNTTQGEGRPYHGTLGCWWRPWQIIELLLVRLIPIAPRPYITTVSSCSSRVITVSSQASTRHSHEDHNRGWL